MSRRYTSSVIHDCSYGRYELKLKLGLSMDKSKGQPCCNKEFR